MTVITFGKKLQLLIIVVLVMMLVGCKNVPIVDVPEPSEPVKSNIARYEAPERTIAPEPQDATGIG